MSGEHPIRRTTDQCSHYDECQKSRETAAEFRGTVLAGIGHINLGIEKMWLEMTSTRKDVQALYFRVGLISGGTALIISLVVSLVASLLRGGGE